MPGLTLVPILTMGLTLQNSKNQNEETVAEELAAYSGLLMTFYWTIETEV